MNKIFFIVNMPRRYRKRTFRRRPRKLWRRARKGRNARASRSRMSSLIVPDRAFTKLKYQQKLALNSTQSQLVAHVFHGNSVYDPDVTSTGAQPAGYDNWSAFYESYRVYGSKIRVDFISTDGSAPTQTWQMGIIPTNVLTAGLGMEAIMANPYSKWRVKNLVNMSNVTIRSFMSTGKILGLSKTAVKTDDTLSGFTGNFGTGANPSIDWFWSIIAQPTQGGQDGTIYAYVTITYYTEFFGRKPLALS